MNIYEKINAVRVALLKSGIAKEKSGNNNYYKYIDLPQIEGIITEECNKVGLLTLIDFPDGHATMTAIDLEKSDISSVTISVPCDASMVDIRGSQQIQKVGGMMTYMRRYLYMQMFAISEHDSVEGIGKFAQETANDVDNIDNSEEKEIDKERAEILELYKKNLPDYLNQLVAYKKVKSVNDIPTDYLKQVYENKMKKQQKEQTNEQGNLL